MSLIGPGSVMNDRTCSFDLHRGHSSTAIPKTRAISFAHPSRFRVLGWRSSAEFLGETFIFGVWGSKIHLYFSDLLNKILGSFIDLIHKSNLGRLWWLLERVKALIADQVQIAKDREERESQATRQLRWQLKVLASDRWMDNDVPQFCCQCIDSGTQP